MPLLKRDLSVQVTGDTSADMQAFAPTKSGQTVLDLMPSGVTVRYGINSIPTATLDLTPLDLDLVCDFEQWRRTPVKVRIESIHGCMTFRGLIDGMSFSQSVGDMRLQLVVKSPFQILSEINPKLLGYHSSGVDFTRRVEVLSMERHQAGAVAADTHHFTLFRYILGNEVRIDFLQMSLFDGLLAVLKEIVKSQVQWERTQAKIGQAAEPAIAAAKAMSQTHLKMGLLLLDKIDTSYVKTSLTLADMKTADLVLQGICDTRTNLLDILLSILESVGCSLVIGNEKAFIVPNSGFLIQAHKDKINLKEFSKEANILYPAQYSNLVFNDNGYRDISGVYAMADDRNISQYDGFFQDTVNGGTGGITGEVMPYIISYNNAAARAALQPAAAIGAGNEALPNTGDDLNSQGETADEEAQRVAITSSAAIEEAIAENEQRTQREIKQEQSDGMYKFAAQWAQLRYYQLKYTDRVGGVSTMLNPNFAPGAVGSVYARTPGIYIDFFVTEVTHEVRVSSPGTGTATTNVSFNCGRMGSINTSLLSAGLEQFDLFNGYNATTSATVAAAFVKDLQ